MKNQLPFALLIALLSVPWLPAAPGDGSTLGIGGSPNRVTTQSGTGVFGEGNGVSLTNSVVVGEFHGGITSFGGKDSIIVGYQNFGDNEGYVTESSLIVGTDAWTTYTPTGTPLPITYSLVVGASNTASITSGLVAGVNNYAVGRSFLLGDGLIANAATPLIVQGQYNEAAPPTGKTFRFVIGNGYEPNSGPPVRRNAFEIYTDGEAAFRGPLKLFSGSSTAAGIVLDPTALKITIGGVPVLTGSSTSAQNFTAVSYSFITSNTNANRLTIDQNGLTTVGGTRPANDATSLLHVKGQLAVWPDTATAWPNTRASASFAKGPEANYVLMSIPTRTTSGLALHFDDSQTGEARYKTIFGAQQGAIEFKTGVTFNGNWSTTGDTRLRIEPSGNVGIGTVSPQATLDVNGTVRMSRQGDVGMGRFGYATDY